MSTSLVPPSLPTILKPTHPIPPFFHTTKSDTALKCMIQLQGSIHFVDSRFKNWNRLNLTTETHIFDTENQGKIPCENKQKLNERYNENENSMHRIKEDKNFEWLVEIQGVCQQIYGTFNWGKNYENFLQTCIDLDMTKPLHTRTYE